MVADAGSFSHFMLRSSSALDDGDSSAEAVVPRSLLPSNTPVRVHSLVVNWRRLISCMGITPEGFTRDTIRALALETQPRKTARIFAPCLRASVVGLRYLVSDRGRHGEATSKMIRTLGAPREHQSE